MAKRQIKMQRNF